jgi:hypothetical protein
LGGAVAHPPLIGVSKMTCVFSGIWAGCAQARNRYAIFLALLCALGILPAADAAPRKARASAEFKVEDRSALGALELVISDPSVSEGLREPVTDLALFVSKSGADIGRILTAQEAQSADAAAASGTLFNVRLFIVAGGRLYSDAKGQCGPWANDVSRCTAACDGGTFALRRKGSAPLEFLLGAIPRGAAGADDGLILSDCSFDETGDIRLAAKASRALAVVGLSDD